MKHYFKWPLDNLIYIWKSNLDIKTVTYKTNDISDNYLSKIRKGYTVKLIDGELSISDDNYIELNKKKKECRAKIEEKYKEHDQINTILFGTTEEKNTMKAYIKACLDEYKNKWKDANFDDIL